MSLKAGIFNPLFTEVFRSVRLAASCFCYSKVYYLNQKQFLYNSRICSFDVFFFFVYPVTFLRNVLCSFVYYILFVAFSIFIHVQFHGRLQDWPNLHYTKQLICRRHNRVVCFETTCRYCCLCRTAPFNWTRRRGEFDKKKLTMLWWALYHPPPPLSVSLVFV